MTSERATRLGLLWQSETTGHDSEQYVVRVVQRGTRLKSTGGFSSLPDELALLFVVVFLPLRLVAMLLARQHYKVGIVRIDGRDNETVSLKESVRGEHKARARALELFGDIEKALEEPSPRS